MAKEVVKAAKKPTVKKTVAPKTPTVESAKVKNSGLSVDVYSLTVATVGSMTLPESIFGAEVNKKLLNQALRVYLTNSQSHWGNTKTRGQVEGSTRKIFRQKGTGNARHGAVRAPIFVGGGISLGPTTRRVRLELPQKMRQNALISALSDKSKNGQVAVVEDLSKATGKTKQMVGLLKKISKPSYLFVVEPKLDQAARGLKNLSDVTLLPVENINVLDIIKYQTVLFTKEAITQLEARLAKKEVKK